ncbi:putative Erythronolide synthase, modules 5 and 6 [Glarea lozoyensis 74030]|uniref:Putative Erythronolide synthase, modules 5 and 6 n=1 Tax=Glarea lozoyensis (strain ATCC 74030 / MF5533) TaxID=1104152 RepID=H0ESE2_GLAL7|nr:putative Erythronolide synthase, modules 5 and 6 [Glarea lozoyensis 74030]
MAATPVAICGMGLRLPGRIKNDADMYKFLMEKRDARSIVPKSRYDIEKYYNEHSKKGTIISKYGYFLEDDLTHFDLSMISMTSVEASRLDPTQRVLLEVVRETFENSGEADFRGKNIGTFANGYGRAEGIACLYVKRLDEAIRDGNPVRAVIRASASNADGKTAALTVPNPVAHESFIRQAYENAGLSFRDTAMVECHGSGTFVGDSLEVSAGHSEGASAITSIIKAVVSLENTTILPNIKFTTPSPKIPWKTGKLQVPTEPLPWPEDRRERISVNSFGIGGSNVHVSIISKLEPTK